MAKKAATYSVVVPVLNRKCSLPNSFPVSLSDSVSIRKVRGDDLVAITEHDTEAASYLHGGKFTITFDDYDMAWSKDQLGNALICALFSLNTISSGSALAVERAFILKSHRITKIEKTESWSGYNHAQQADFKIQSASSVKYARDLYKAVSTAIAKYPPLRLTVNRLNSAIGRSAIDEKIIDLCIALESVFQSQTEISFQFALYNSLLSEGDKYKRREVFALLKKLYGQRSNIVHGNKDADEKWCEDNLPRLLSIAKTSVLQKIEFLANKTHDEWKANLEELALGII
ncbi:MAG: hypothetical protein J0J06_14150 [Sphingomonas sp.]|uniref:HEPN domain-containing protein n=1 Tax=Sphingomonas sp. TaxID=28214 RepID=UPI001ACD65CF|nr:HEPN domain-containing protein [Sphingomonas sp.]MBN8816574.1 hypothetical protein [Sphingomonas sp.]